MDTDVTITGMTGSEAVELLREATTAGVPLNVRPNAMVAVSSSSFADSLFATTSLSEIALAKLDISLFITTFASSRPETSLSRPSSAFLAAKIASAMVSSEFFSVRIPCATFPSAFSCDCISPSRRMSFA